MPTNSPPPDELSGFSPVRSLGGYLATVGEFNRNVRLFLAVTAFRGLVIASSQTVFNLYLFSLGYSTQFIGLITAVNAIATLLVSVPLGYLADRLGRRLLLLVGGVAYSLFTVGLSLAHSTALLLGFNFVLGGVSTAYWVAGVPLLFASTGERERVHAFSVNSFLLWGLGPLGALLSGQIVEVVARVAHVSASSAGALRAGMFFMAFLAAAGAVPYFFLHEAPRAPAVSNAPQPAHSHLTRLFLQLLIPDLILAFGLGSVLTFSQLYFHLRFHLDPGPVGIVVAVAGIASGIAALFTPVLARRWGNLRTAVRAEWLAAPLIAVVALSTSLVVALPAYWLVLMLRGMADPVYTSFVQERVPDHLRARLTGMYSVTYSIGYSLGPAASGVLQSRGGFTPAFLMGAVTYFLGATLLFVFFGRRVLRRRTAESGAT